MRHPGQLSPGRPELLTSSVERCRGRPSRPSPLALRRARSPRPPGTRATHHPGTSIPARVGASMPANGPSHPQPPPGPGPQAPAVATPAQASPLKQDQQRNPQYRLTHVLLRWCRHRFPVRRLIPAIRHASELLKPCAISRANCSRFSACGNAPRPTAPHRNPRTHRVLRRPLETAPAPPTTSSLHHMAIPRKGTEPGAHPHMLRSMRTHAVARWG